MGNELRNGPGRERRIDGHDKWEVDDARDRRDVADEIETEVFVKRRIDRIGRRGQQEGVTVCRRLYDRLGADIARGASTILDDELLAEPLRQPLRHQARDDVASASCRK